jgi:RNA polymerase sigma-70 factor, ECF subfamily
VTSRKKCYSDRELADGLSSGQPEAFADLYDRYGELAYQTALRVVRDPTTAEDVVQDCFLKFWRMRSRFDAQRGSFRTWVVSAVRNRSIDYLRGRHAHERQEHPIPEHARARGRGSNPWREVASLMARTALEEALSNLPGEQREAVELAYLIGHSNPQIAEITGVPLSTVKGRLRLGRRKLHSCLQALDLLDADDEDSRA